MSDETRREGEKTNLMRDGCGEEFL